MTIRQWLLAGIGASALAGCISVSEVRTPAVAAYPAPSSLAGAPRGIAQERLRNLDQAMKAYIDQGKLAGAVVMIHQDGREVFSEAYGWRDK
jgi:hypothetical protein